MKLRPWFLIALYLIGEVASAQEIDPRYATNADCQACHTDISKQWATSRHAHSHFSKNQLYDRSIEAIVNSNMQKIREEIIVECAKCHNPRIEERKINEVEKLGLLLEIDTKKMKKVLNNATMQNGINCIVCHNVDEIHLQKDNPKVRGFDAVKFGPQGVMYGPFKGAESPYHLTQQREFFVKDPSRLCFVCHYSDVNSHGLEIYSTGKEYEEAQPPEGEKKAQCIVCHMSAKKKGVASNYRKKGGNVVRMVRDHLFASIDNGTMYKKYLLTHAKVDDGTFLVTIVNKSPHRVPTGYGLRRLELVVRFYGEGDRKLGEIKTLYSAKWKDAKGQETIPHLATVKSSDTRIPPYGKVVERFKIPHGTQLINYRLIYRQISPEMAKKLGVKDEFFTRKYLLKNGVVEL